MPFQADFSSVENREPIPGGPYKATIIQVPIEPPSETAKARGSSYDGIVVHFEISAGEHTDRVLKRKFSLSPKAMGFIYDLWEAAGMPQEKSANIQLDERDLLNKEVIINVGHYPQEGKPGKFYNEIDSVEAVY